MQDSKPPASTNSLLSIIVGSRCLRAMSATILGRLATSGSPGAISAPARCLTAAAKTSSKSAYGDEFGRERGQPVVAVLGEAVFDDDVLAFDVTVLAQGLLKRRPRGGAEG